MKRRNLSLLAVMGALLTFVVVLWVILRPDSVRLRWKFRKADVWRYQVTMQTSAITSSCTYSMTVLDIDPEGTATILCKCEAASTKSRNWDYDSRRDTGEPTNPVAQAFFRRLNNTMTIRMNPLGYVAEVDGNATRSIAKGVGLLSIYDSFLYPTCFSLDGALVWHLPLPEAQVGQGSSWSLDLEDRAIRMPHEDRFTRTFHLRDISRPEARISLEDSFAKSRQEWYDKGKLRVERHLNAVFSVDQGRLLSYSFEQKVIGGNPEKTMIESLDVRMLSGAGP